MSRQAEHAVAVSQWHALRTNIIDAGSNVRAARTGTRPARPGIHCKRRDDLPQAEHLISRFRHRQRQGEEPYNRRWLYRKRALKSSKFPKTSASKRPATPSSAATRSTPATACEATPPDINKLAACSVCRVIPVELVDARYYHLDTCFCPLADGEAIWFPPAFDEYGQKAIREHVPKLIEVEREEAERFACNAVVIGRQVITRHGLRPPIRCWHRADTIRLPRHSMNL